VKAAPIGRGMEREYLTIPAIAIILFVYILSLDQEDLKNQAVFPIDHQPIPEPAPQQVQTVSTSALEHVFNGKKKFNGTLPSFIITGVMKCGTGAVSKFLARHSKLTDVGETYFFNRYYNLGFGYYENILNSRGKGPTRHKSTQFVFEKTPTYYKTLKTAKLIADLDPDMKFILIVCDNVKRTLSRYLHIRNLRTGKDSQKKQRKIKDLGETVEEFSININQTISELQHLFDVIRESTNNDDELFLENLFERYIKRRRPFSTKDSTQRELVLSDGFYSIFYTYWLRFFNKDQILVVDGSRISSNPAVELVRIQQFLGLDIEIDAANFVYNEERGFFCFRQTKQSSCLGAGKGRSHGLNFEPDLNERLHEFFRFFDGHFSRLVGMEFDWHFR